MPYLNLDLNYFDHIKPKRLIGLLGRGAAELPLRLWCYCGNHKAKDGILTGYSTQEIESIVDWRGKPGQCVEAMVTVGFLEKIENGFRVHGWDEHEGHLAAFHERAKKAAMKRWGLSSASSIASGNAPSVPAVPSLPNGKDLSGLPPDAFDMIWKTYPSKAGKKAALRSFRASMKSAEDWRLIQVALNKYLKLDKVKRGFILNGSTWFANWRDYLEYVEPGSPKAEKFFVWFKEIGRAGVLKEDGPFDTRQQAEARAREMMAGKEEGRFSTEIKVKR